MVENKKQHNNEDDAGRKDVSVKTTTQKESKRTRKGEEVVLDIDKMKIIDLKDELRQLGLSTTGNKTLKIRLQNSRARANRVSEIVSRTNDKDTKP